MALSNHGQISLDFVIAVLFALAIFFALYPMIQSIQQNSFLASDRVQERTIANELASKIPLLQSLSDDENFLVRTGSIMDANKQGGLSNCQITVTKNPGSSNGRVAVYYPPNNPIPITQSFAMSGSFQLVGNPITIPCGCVTLSRFNGSYFGVARC